MGEIVASVQRVTDIMAEISAASQEQPTGIEQVNQTVVQMDETTQQNAALVEEATAAARAMEDQAVQLVKPWPASGWHHTARRPFRHARWRHRYRARSPPPHRRQNGPGTCAAHRDSPAGTGCGRRLAGVLIEPRGQIPFPQERDLTLTRRK